MKLRLVSDIHLELSNHISETIGQLSSQIITDNIEDVLILAGDIGDPFSESYKDFLARMSHHFNKIFIVSGNHEYYKTTVSTMKEIDDKIREVTESFNNVHFLQRDSIIYNRVRFLGCTLWSRVKNSSNCVYMNDFTLIPEMTFNMYRSLHTNDVKWLKGELNKTGDFDSTVVVTHHLPSYKLINHKYEGNLMNEFFASDLDYLVKKASIWCCGHTHSANKIVIGECHCYVNPVGYSGEITNFQPKLCIDILKSLCDVEYI